MEGKGEMENRIGVVDRLRGLCLFGILMANMLIFQYGIYGKDQLSVYSVSSMDQVVHGVLKVFVETSFMPIFAFLFGYGLIKMTESLDRKGLPRKRFLVRRFIGLIIIGIFHGTLLWEGDILLSYGMTGFVLLLFMGRRSKTLKIWALLLFVIIGGLGLGGTSLVTSEEEQLVMDEYVKQTEIIYGSGTFGEIMDHRLNEDPLMMTGGELVVLLILSPILTLPMFLFGMVAAKERWFYEVRTRTTKWRRKAVLFVGLGIALKAMNEIWPDFIGSGVGYALGGPVLAFGYIFGFTLWLSSRHSIFTKGLERVGRLSLSNYILQTIICVSVFYGFGFGWFGELGMLTGVALSVLIFSAQWFISLLYLSKFQTGPLEKPLRMWTYFSWNGKAKPNVGKREDRTFTA